MDFGLDLRMTPQEMAERSRQVGELNAEAFKDSPAKRAPKQALGEEDFLALLMKQLEYQDPLAPMEDREFIAQMAQFSSLKEITAMSQGFSQLSLDFGRIAKVISGGEATAALGKQVEISDGEKVVQGTVRAVTRGDNPQILVNGAYYDWSQVAKVFE
jgi:flagellar basal-body rod modification protein FlgD